MIVGEFPHEADILKGEPFVGGPGWELTKMLSDAKIFRESCFLTMVCRERAPGGRTEGLVAAAKKDITQAHVLCNGKWVLPQVVEGMKLLKSEIERVKPNVIVALGNLALFALTGEWGANAWRSSIMESTLVPGAKVIPTINPAMVVIQWSLRSLVVHDLKRALRQSAFPGVIRAEYKLVIRPDYETACNTLNKLIDAALVIGDSKMHLGADIETRAGHIACISFAWSPTEAICIPLMCVSKPEGYWTLEEESQLILLMCRLMRLCKVIGQNWNYDESYILRFWHFLCPDVEDTMIQQHSCFSNVDKNLSFLSSMYCEDHLHWKDDRTNWTEGPNGEGEDTYWIYNCTDSMRTLAIHAVLTKVIEAMGLVEVNNFQQNLRVLVSKAMDRGVRVDMEERKRFSFQMLNEVAERDNWITEVVGHELNIQSPKQMQEFFFGEMAMTPIKDKKTHSLTTNDEALQVIGERCPIMLPITRKIAELRSLKVLHSTFILAPVDKDVRIRTSFNVCGTDTYRFASKKNPFGGGCNFQNVTKGGETEDGLILPNVRTLFVPDPGMTMFDTDLDSADLRIVAWESDCKWLKEQFRTGQKPYVSMMKEYYQDASITKNHKSYPMFKATAHGSNYLGTAAGMAPRIGLDVKLVQKLQDWYFDLCPEVVAWQNEIKKQVAGRRYVENAFGYRMHFFDRIQGTIFNQAVAWIPQSSVACLINRVWMNIEKNLKEVEVLIQVHDSLVGSYPTHLGDWAKRRILEESAVSIPYADQLVIPMGIATSTKSWGHCK
jgi:DNA polymerase I-like protein with 3'-5' exonuclease and polymerase domains/uracil-DNA glycosylase